ncbi:MAG: multicopper oxidase domain-containing protein [Candidatus Kapaibacterium sp.]
MHQRFLIPLFLFIATATAAIAQPYTTLWIPDTLSGTTFALTMNMTTKQFRTGAVTNTYGYNGNTYLGPTLIMHKGDSVQIHVTNNLMDSTTLHWHGFHIPAMMDGGPHQPIPPGTTWSPTFRIRNNAATFWYHPHLHMMTEQQMMMGLTGMIIVRDDQESALALPRTYGVDDIPLILHDRRFDNSNQFVMDTYGDSMLVNGTLSAQFAAPAQMVRFRVLNAASERAYNIGFSDNRTFYVIGTDGGLLDAPVPVTRKVLGVGERVEILVNFSSQSGGSVDLMAYNAGQKMGYPGSEPQQDGKFGSALNNKNFRMLHIAVGPSTTAPIMVLPTKLTSIAFLDAAAVNVTRQVQLTDGFNGSAFHFDSTPFDMEVINKTVHLNDMEIWELKNVSAFSHTFHIHDVEFNILSRNGAAPNPEEHGWKDVALVNMNETVRFITRFEDFADPEHPYMYHCHIGFHEDGGMMGQFVVINAPSGVAEQEVATGKNAITISPNPATDLLTVKMSGDIAKIQIINYAGMIVTERIPSANGAVDIASLPAGLYFLRATDTRGNCRVGRFIRM